MLNAEMLVFCPRLCWVWGVSERGIRSFNLLLYLLKLLYYNILFNLGDKNPTFLNDNAFGFYYDAIIVIGHLFVCGDCLGLIGTFNGLGYKLCF